MRALKINWVLWIALACLLATGAYLYFRLTAAMPPNNGSIVYAFLVAYNYTALPVSITVVLAALIGIFLWLPEFMVRAPGFGRDGVLLVRAVGAAVLAVWVALPLGREIYREVPNGTLAATGRTYHLGARVSPDPDQNAYVLCVCPGLVCQCQYLYDESLQTLEPLPELKLAADGRLIVQVADRVLYAGQP